MATPKPDKNIAERIFGAIVAGSFINQITGILIAGILAVAWCANSPAAVSNPWLPLVGMILIAGMVGYGLHLLRDAGRDPLSRLPPDLLAQQMQAGKEKGAILDPTAVGVSAPPAPVTAKRRQAKEKTNG